MLEFEEYKVKLNNLKPELEELYTSLGLEQAKREERGAGDQVLSAGFLG